MSFYLEIMGVPVERDTNCLTAPGAEMAVRLEAHQETVELRFHRMDGKTHCYLGLSDHLRVRQAKSILHSNGFLVKDIQPPPGGMTTMLVRRMVNRRPLVRPGLPPQQMLLPMTVIAHPGRADAMFRTLSELKDGCGVAFFFRLAPALPLQLGAYLNQMGSAADSLCYELLHRIRLYEAVGCVYGSGQDAQMLASEVCCAYGGMEAVRIPATQVGSELFDRLAASNADGSPAHGLRGIFLEEELAVLSDLRASAGIYGLPLNKDTIFGIPLPRKDVNAPSVRLGFAADGTPVTLPLKLLRQHMFIGGTAGTGKGNQFFSLAIQLHQQGVPMLLIESAKEEMHHLGKVMPDLQIWRPNEGEYVLNPFCLEDDITCGEMRASLLQTLRLCFKLDGPLEELFSETLTRCFAKNGFHDDATAFTPGVMPFGMSEFMEEYVHLLEDKGYSQRTKDDMKTAGMVRLGALFNENRAVFDTINSVPIPELLAGENLIQLNCLPTVEAKQMFASLLLISISAWLRLRGKHCVDRPLKLAIILDESHNLLQPVTDSEGKTFSFARDFANMLLELRSQGVAILLADQSANNIPREITAACATKVFMGSSASSGIDSQLQLLGSDETALRHLHLLEPGEGIYVTPGMATAAFFSCPNVIDHFQLEQEYARKNHYLEQHPRFTLETYRECSVCPARGGCTRRDKVEARQLASNLCQEYGPRLGKLMKQENGDKQITATLIQAIRSLHSRASAQRYCSMVQFVRDFNRENPGSLSLEKVLVNAERVWDAMKK